MKKVILALTLFGALFFTANTVSAKGVIFYSLGEKFDIAQKLPDNFKIDGNHVNLGIMYKQFSVFWIPVWNYGETTYVFINDKEDGYYDVDAEDIETLKTKFNVTVPEKPTLSFWNKIGGKLVCLVIILVLGFFALRKGDD